VNSFVEVSDKDEGHDRKTYDYIILADFGERPMGKLYKTKLYNYPEFEVLDFNNESVSIKIKHKDDNLTWKEETVKLPVEDHN
jgi:hypothetical protein